MTQIASSNNKCKSLSSLSVPKTVVEVSNSVYKIEGADFERGYWGEETALWEPCWKKDCVWGEGGEVWKGGRRNCPSLREKECLGMGCCVKSSAEEWKRALKAEDEEQVCWQCWPCCFTGWCHCQQGWYLFGLNSFLVSVDTEEGRLGLTSPLGRGFGQAPPAHGAYCLGSTPPSGDTSVSWLEGEPRTSGCPTHVIGSYVVVN